MSCICGKEALLTLGDKVWCMGCFIEQFERRVKRALRENPFHKVQKVLVVGALAAFVFRKIISMPLDVTFNDTLQEGYDRTVIEWTLDDECIDFLEHMATDGIQHDEHIKLFLHLRDKEVAAYAKLHAFLFVPRKKSNAWTDFIAVFQPDMLYNLLNNAQEFKNIRRQTYK